MNAPFAAALLCKDFPTLSDAVSRIPADAAPHRMNDPFDIGEALYGLAQSGDPVTIHADHRMPVAAPPGTPAMARILSVDPELPLFVLDFGDNPPPALPVTCVAVIKGDARLQFTLDSGWSALPVQPHLVQAAFPASCLVLDRRAARRIEAPVGANYVASFGLQGRHYELPLFDFSQGGIGMRGTPEQCAELTVGKQLKGVRLELGPALVVVADLEIRLLRPFRTFLLGEQVQIGCSFASISMQMQHKLAQCAGAGQGERQAAFA